MRELGDAYSRTTSDIRPGVGVGRKGKTFFYGEEVQSLTLLYIMFDS